MEDVITDATKSIPAFYAGQSIFLTGATGFMGKVFIEKVLRSCSEVREIFLLIRPKKGVDVRSRLEKILNLPIFDKLRNEHPSSFEKLIPVTGDASEKGLGLSSADREILIQRVTIVVHCSASVRFNDSLKYSVFINIRSVRDVCMLAENMKNLVALVYVGTAYAHTHNKIIQEKTYPPKTDWRKMIEIAESLDDHTLNIFTAKYINDAANTYVFCKNLAEGVIQDYAAQLPCVIFRPSMISGAFSEPCKGWVDNIYGPIGLYIGGGKGLLQVAYANSVVKPDILPVDVVIKSLLQVIWKCGLIKLTTASFTDSPLVFNCTVADLKKLSCQQIKYIFWNLLEEIPFEEILWTPGATHVTSYVLYYTLFILWQLIPALFIDMILKCCGRLPILLKLQRNIFVANTVMSYFTINEWMFDNTEVLKLNSIIPLNDMEAFKFSTDIEIKKYMEIALSGAKQFLLREDLSPQALAAAKVHSKRIRLIATILRICLAAGALWVVYKWNILSFILRPFSVTFLAI